MSGMHVVDDLGDDPDADEPFSVSAVPRNGERRADRVKVVVRRSLTFAEAENLTQALIGIADLEGAKA